MHARSSRIKLKSQIPPSAARNGRPGTGFPRTLSGAPPEAPLRASVLFKTRVALLRASVLFKTRVALLRASVHFYTAALLRALVLIYRAVLLRGPVLLWGDSFRSLGDY